MNTNQKMLLLALSSGLIYCGGSTAQKAEVTVAEGLSLSSPNTAVVVDDKNKVIKDDVPATPATPAAAVEEKKEPQSLILSQTPWDIRQSTKPITHTINKPSAPAPPVVVLTVPKRVEEKKPEVKEVVLTEEDKVEVDNPFKGDENLSGLFTSSKNITDLLGQDKILAHQRRFIARAYMVTIEDKNTNLLIDERIKIVFQLAKNQAIASEMKLNLGNFQGAYEKITDESKKATLLPLMYAFHVYNKSRGTDYNDQQGPGYYLSKSFLTDNYSNVLIVGRVHLESDGTNERKLVSTYNAGLIRAIDVIWKQFYVYSIESQGPYTDPVLTGYVNQRSKETDKLAEIALIEAKKVKEAITSDSTPKVSNHIPALPEKAENYSFLYDNDRALSPKNNRVELVLSREMAAEPTN